MTNILATKRTVTASIEGSARDEWAIHTQCKRVNLDRAKNTDYMVIVHNGVIQDVAKVYGAEREPQRWVPGDKPSERVAFIVGPNVEPEIEALIGTPLAWEGSNPNVYYTLDEEGVLHKA